MKFVFYDFNKEVIQGLFDTYQHFRKSHELINCIKEIEFMICDTEHIKTTYLNKNDKTIVVSPANSFGSMGGGIDYYIKHTMMNDPDIDIEQRVKDTIKSTSSHIYKDECFFDNTQFKNSHYLPVGENCMVHYKDNIYLAVVPTMEYPMNINGTYNVERAMNSFIRDLEYNMYEIDDIDSYTVCICGMGSGIGGLEYSQMVIQMLFPLFKGMPPSPYVYIT
jgi:hypothetical protein